MDPYRGGEIKPIKCPRCKKREMSPVTVGECECGRWVPALIADIVFTPRERRPTPVAWWRILEDCPLCEERMSVYGERSALFQGCAPHGYFVDADTVSATSLARPLDQAAIGARQGDMAAREALLELETRQQRERREADAAMSEIHAADARVERERRARVRAEIASRENAEREAVERREASARAWQRQREHEAAEERARMERARDPLEVLEERVRRLEDENQRLRERVSALEQANAQGT